MSRFSEVEVNALGAGPPVGGCVELLHLPLSSSKNLVTAFTTPPWPHEPFESLRATWLARHRADHNGSKLSFAHFMPSEGEGASICLSETDWAAVQSAQDEWTATPPPAWRLDALREMRAARSFRYPNIAVVHGIVVTTDRMILISQRGAELRYHPLHWSATFEEGLEARMDGIEGRDIFGTCARRGLVEEFGLAPELVANFEVVPASLVLELGNGNPALIVVVDAKLTMEELVECARPGDEVESDRLRSLAVDSPEFEALMFHGILGEGQTVHPTSQHRAGEARRYLGEA